MDGSPALAAEILRSIPSFDGIISYKGSLYCVTVTNRSQSTR